MEMGAAAPLTGLAGAQALYAWEISNAPSISYAASSAWASAGVAAVVRLWLIIAAVAIAVWAASYLTWRTPCPQKVATPEQREKEEHRSEDPLEPTNHFLALPDDVLALVFASLSKAISIQAQLQDVLRAGACCKAFAARAHEAVAARHGWRLPLDGTCRSWRTHGALLMRHLSKVGQDTKWIRSILRDDSSFWWSAGIDSESAVRLLEFVSCWNQEAPLDFVGPRVIYPEVRRQHIPELSGLLIELATSVSQGDPDRDGKISSFLRPLVGIIAQPGTPLNTSWLAPRVFLLVKKHMNVNGTFGHSYDSVLRQTRNVLLDLLGLLEPHVLRSDPEIFKWLQYTLQRLPKSRVTASGQEITGWNDSMWNVGLVAWNERCEAQRLQLGSRGDEGHDVNLEAILDKQVRGCFASCSALGTPPWSSKDSWRSVKSQDVFHAVYHDSPVGRVPRPDPPWGVPFFTPPNYYYYHRYYYLPLLRLRHLQRTCGLRWSHLWPPACVRDALLATAIVLALCCRAA